MLTVLIISSLLLLLLSSSLSSFSVIIIISFIIIIIIITVFTIVIIISIITFIIIIISYHQSTALYRCYQCIIFHCIEVSMRAQTNVSNKCKAMSDVMLAFRFHIWSNIVDKPLKQPLKNFYNLFPFPLVSLHCSPIPPYPIPSCPVQFIPSRDPILNIVLSVLLDID